MAKRTRSYGGPLRLKLERKATEHKETQADVAQEKLDTVYIGKRVLDESDLPLPHASGRSPAFTYRKS